VPAPIVHLGWELVPLFFSLLAITLFYFVYTLTEEKDINTRGKILLAALLLPILLLLPTEINTTHFDIILCEAAVGPISYYVYFLIASIAISIVFITLRKSLTHKVAAPTYLMIGSVSMLSVLVFADFISESIGHFEINLIGPIGMIVFLAAISYMIVKFKAFNIKLVGAQALVITLWILIGSLLFVEKETLPRTITIFTLVFATFAGWLLIRSVKKEVQQREELEVLTHKLEAANVRLKELDKAKSEFVSIASHQLRSPLTAIRGYASMLAEGSFGQLPAKAAESAKRIEDSAKLMAMSIEDYLNVSRIESGNMKYNLSDFNLLEMTSKLCDDLRPEAMNRNLILLFRSDLKGKGLVNADVGKTNQIIHNLVNNSIKYTPKGSVSVFVRDDIKTKRIYIDITDTGIGMSKETMDKLFGKFSRANNANSVNTSGTGLGLYVALKMAEAMGGHISCTSEGDGKGSTFTFELPLAM
jgi:signal transduction histidine kinase